MILLCQTYIWYTLNKLSPPPSSCYSAHTKCSLKSLSLNLATLEDAQLAPHTGHQTALCTWNLSSTKLAGLGQGKAPSGAHGAPWPALGSWSPPNSGDTQHEAATVPVHKVTACRSTAACLTLADNRAVMLIYTRLC